ncbi:PEP-CTERM sorting domain-containing protein [Poriferisphaera sp. WC338]|uniref:PEP-CTERM sorting domain-containing protein n=1 Tax=Poriferisphaera sp. WC338 TaxID=3425129 RepID=UPI003D81631B
MKKTGLAALGLGLAICGMGTATVSADVIAYWDQNSNTLTGGGFGFEVGDFPQAADVGTGSLTLQNFVGNADGSGVYGNITSSVGTTENAQPSVTSGGSLTIRRGTTTGGASTNNGASIWLSASTIGLEDIIVSWAQRGTSTGFDSRVFAYSTNGIDFTDFGTDSGDLTSTWETESYDLSAISALENVSTVYFRITLNGATGTTGNNRFDNITIEGSAIPEPASLALLGFGGLVALSRRK